MRDVWEQVLIETIKEACLDTEHLRMIYRCIVKTKMQEMKNK